MKFASFRTPGGDATFGRVEGGEVIDLRHGVPGCARLRDYLATDAFAARAALSGMRHAISDVVLLPVIPDPGKIICVGLNYKEHVQETGRSDSEHPALFMRSSISQTAHGAPLLKPRTSQRFDYEGELAIVIGKPGRRISEAEALSHVAGYACYNDGSVRDWQRHTHQWTPGKNFDQTGAFGPWLVTPDEMGDRASTWLTTRVNGIVVQRASLAQMIFSIEEIIAYVSGFTTLEVGDVIVTGTPGGVGDRRSPPLYLFDGDVVEVEIDGVGVLRNPVAEE